MPGLSYKTIATELKGNYRTISCPRYYQSNGVFAPQRVRGHPLLSTQFEIANSNRTIVGRLSWLDASERQIDIVRWVDFQEKIYGFIQDIASSRGVHINIQSGRK
jgi:hypothetical protein